MKYSKALLGATALVSGLLACAPAFAQTQEGAVEELVVTGSRIKRADIDGRRSGQRHQPGPDRPVRRGQHGDPPATAARLGRVRGQPDQRLLGQPRLGHGAGQSARPGHQPDPGADERPAAGQRRHRGQQLARPEHDPAQPDRADRGAEGRRLGHLWRRRRGGGGQHHHPHGPGRPADRRPLWRHRRGRRRGHDAGPVLRPAHRPGRPERGGQLPEGRCGQHGQPRTLLTVGIGRGADLHRQRIHRRRARLATQRTDHQLHHRRRLRALQQRPSRLQHQPLHQRRQPDRAVHPGPDG